MSHFKGATVKAVGFADQTLRVTLMDRCRKDSTQLKQFLYRVFEGCLLSTDATTKGLVNRMKWEIDGIEMCQKSFAACYGVSPYMLDEISRIMKETQSGNPNLAPVGRQMTDSSKPDVGFYGAQLILDTNLVETPNDGKYSYSNFS
jgi:hypothetical protein